MHTTTPAWHGWVSSNAVAATCIIVIPFAQKEFKIKSIIVGSLKWENLHLVQQREALENP
jgi:hypothetical protein